MTVTHPFYLRPFEIYLKNMTEMLTDEDGECLFNRETRHFPPLQHQLDAKKVGGWWPNRYLLQDTTCFSRPYAEENHIPHHYVIVSTDCFKPRSETERKEMIKVSYGQVAIPMKWFFRQNDLNLMEQWEFIRHYYKYIPRKVRNASLIRAYGMAIDLGIEEGLRSLFYDLKEEDPKEYDTRIHTYYEKRNELNKQMKECLNAIIQVRQREECGWDEKWERLYVRYEKSSFYDYNNFYEFCKYLSEYDEDFRNVFKVIWKPGTIFWQIAVLTDMYVKQRFEYRKVVDDMENFLMYNSFG